MRVSDFVEDDLQLISLNKATFDQLVPQGVKDE